VFSAGQRSWTWNGRAWQATSVTTGYTGSQGIIGYTGSVGPSTSTSVVGQVLTSNGPSNTAVWASVTGNRNRIINGAMVIDQRNNGGSGTATGYTVDRWTFNATQASKITWQQNAGGFGTSPAGFSYYLGMTSSSNYTSVSTDYFNMTQKIEGLNLTDLQWGTANALPVTLSFYVRSNLTGSFGGSIQNSAQSRSYVFTFNITAANTWQYVNITVPGDTGGPTTWLTTNGIGAWVNFSLGTGANYNGTASAWQAGNFYSTSGSNNIVSATSNYLYITGVQFESGAYASTFDWRLLPVELALCQRYFYSTFPLGTAPAQSVSSCLYTFSTTITNYLNGYMFPVQMRTTPAITTYNPFAANGSFRVPGGSTDIAVTPSNVSGTSIGYWTTTLTAPSGAHGNFTANIEL
jgi:hypothetical protein